MTDRKETSDILSYDQYAEIAPRLQDGTYVLEIQQADQCMLFYGSCHATDVEHPEFQDMEERWQKFITKWPQPVALVEGNFDQAPFDETVDAEEAIKAGGELEFLVHLARKDGIELASPEPDRAGEANEVAKSFDRSTVAFFYFIRQIGAWISMHKKPGIRAEATRLLGIMKETYQWDDIDLSIEAMEAIHQQLFGKALPWDDGEWIDTIVTPATTDFVTNEIARTSGEVRDEHILDQIIGYWKAGKSPFIVFGSAHAIRLEPALRRQCER